MNIEDVMEEAAERAKEWFDALLEYCSEGGALIAPFDEDIEGIST